MTSAAGKVLVTGANGFTGAWFCAYLAKRGVPTRGMYYGADGTPPPSPHPNLELVPGDLLDRESLKRALDGVTLVQNIAALYRRTDVPQKAYWDVNVDGIRNIVEEAAKAGVKRFVQCSTVGVHGGVENPPADENAPIKPDDYYQESKYQGEILARELGPSLGMQVSVVRPAAIYGPRETRFLKVAKTLKSGTFIMFGTGEVRYHFVHVEDLCDALCLCAERDEAIGEVFIIADAGALSLNEIVQVMSEALKIKPPRLRLPYPLLYGAAAACEFVLKPFPVSPPLHRRRAAWFNATRHFDITKARQRLGYDPKIAPEDGLREMVRSYQEAGWL